MITINITCSDFTEAAVLLAKCAEGKRLLDGDDVTSVAEADVTSVAEADVTSVAEADVTSVAEADVTSVAEAAIAADSAGLPWDDRVHSSSKALNADGTWRKRRGVTDETVAAVEAELRGQPATEVTVEDRKPVDQPKAEPEAKKFELQDVRDALQLVVDKHGMDAARAFITQQGFERVTAIPEDKFGDFIRACRSKAA